MFDYIIIIHSVQVGSLIVIMKENMHTTDKDKLSASLE